MVCHFQGTDYNNPMSTVLSVTSTASPSAGRSSPAYLSSRNISAVLAPVSSSASSKTKKATADKSSDPATPQDLPMALLQSVAQPPVNDMQAMLDYYSLRTALRSGNQSVAQLAYLRLQTDLSLPHLTSVTDAESSSSAATTAVSQSDESHLNIAV
jgi:hypothetical protein